MKALLSLAIFISSVSFAATQKFETICKQRDCFKYGWTTKSQNYVLDTNCKGHNCRQFGWASIAKDHSTYDVNCIDGACFKNGWTSVQNDRGLVLYDIAFCRNSNCLERGWVVSTGYDLMGGNVNCNHDNCSEFGGTSVWRGHPSKTTCYNQDCYHEGWTLEVF